MLVDRLLTLWVRLLAIFVLIFVVACSAEIEPAEDVSVESAEVATAEIDEEPTVEEGLPAEPDSDSIYQAGDPLPDIAPCKIADQDDDPHIGVGFPRNERRPSSVGTLNVMMMFVDFPDAEGIRPIEDIVATMEPAVDYYEAVSYGRMSIAFNFPETWVRMSETSDVYFGGEYEEDLAFMMEAIEQTDDDLDFSGTDVLYMIASDAINLDTSSALGIDENDLVADGKDIADAAFSSEDYDDPDVAKIFAHELGHNLGLADLYAYDDPQDEHQFVGIFDIMGNLWGEAPEMMAIHRWMLEWLDDDQIYCQETDEETIALTPIEMEGGLKAVMIPVSETQMVVVESRRALGYDSDIPEEGALVYLLDSSLDSGFGSITVFPDEGELRAEAPLSVGERVTVEGVTIEVIRADDENDVVRVSRDG